MKKFKLLGRLFVYRKYPDGFYTLDKRGKKRYHLLCILKYEGRDGLMIICGKFGITWAKIK